MLAADIVEEDVIGRVYSVCYHFHRDLITVYINKVTALKTFVALFTVIYVDSSLNLVFLSQRTIVVLSLIYYFNTAHTKTGTYLKKADIRLVFTNYNNSYTLLIRSG